MSIGAPNAAISKWTRRLARFRRDERGNFAIITGVCAMAMMMTAGIAVDYTRLSSARSQVFSALDSAVLAAGVKLSSGNVSVAEVEGEFRDFFEANLQSGVITADDVTITELEIDSASGSVKASASARVPMTFMALSGSDSVDVGATAAAAFSADDIEVAMVLDVTGSMDGAKIRDLKLAARDAVDILLPAGATGNRMRIGLVPYSWSVNAGAHAWTATEQQSRRCVTERSGPQAFTDAGHDGNPVGADPRAVKPNWCPSQPVRGLTGDSNTLRADIGRFAADGWTAGHIGIAWGYYMLSQNWRPLWSASEDPAPYSDEVNKIVILMTDGQFNTFYDVADPARTFGDASAESNAAAVALCQDMKAPKLGGPGITIYSVVFQPPAKEKSTIMKTLSACASSPAHLFDAANGAQLRDAFRKIAADIQKLRLTR